jgi:TetR/AcrR family transcriptional repressor of multidrug resistance operon
VEPASADRAAAVRSALRALVARGGFHGASMSAVASEAGVATGTAYTYYSSKDELILAAYVHTKAELGRAATADVHHGAEPPDRFVAIWLALYRHLAAHRHHAVFLLQVECSPYRERAHAASLAREDDPLLEQARRPDLAARLAPMPVEVIYELGLAPAVRLAAQGSALSEEELLAVARACWRAISVQEPAPANARRLS